MSNQRVFKHITAGKSIGLIVKGQVLQFSNPLITDDPEIIKLLTDDGASAHNFIEITEVKAGKSEKKALAE